MEIFLKSTDIDRISEAVTERMLKAMQAFKPQSEDIIFDIEGLADYLKVSKSWLYERTHLKEIPHLKIGGQLRFKRSQIDKWIQEWNIPAVKQ